MRRRSTRGGAWGGAAWLATLACVACGEPPARPPPAPPAGPAALYRVVAERPDSLSVRLRARDPAFARLTIEEDAEAFVSGLRAGPIGGELASVQPASWPLALPVCAGPCEIRYQFDLRGAARAFQNPQFGALWDRAILAPPTTFLVRPSAPPRGDFALEVAGAPPAASFACGLAQGPDGVFHARLDDLPKAPYAAWGELHEQTIAIGDARIELVRVGPEPRAGDAALAAWVRRAAEDLDAYFAGYPQPRVVVFALVDEGDSIRNGFSLGNGGAAVLVEVGEDTPDETFARDWIMTHELVHVASPSLAAPHNWLEEGLATYLEPVARAQRGHVDAQAVWSEWFYAMWQGQPQDGDGGLDGTSSWGRLYWGGATFWLLAELAIHEETGGAKGLADCLRAVARASGTIAQRWPVDRYLATCDAGVGAPVVRRLYDRLSAAPITVDLDAVFAKLGVFKAPVGVRFDDGASASALRRRLTPARAGAPQP